MENEYNKIILDFCHELLKKNGVTDLPETLTDQYAKELYAKLQAWLMTSYVAILSQEDADIAHDLLDNPASQEKIEDFFRQKIPNIEEVTSKLMVEFENMYLGK